MKAGAAHELEGMVYRYAWYKDGVLIDGANEAVLAVTEPGSYTVKVSVFNGKVTSAETESAAVVCEFGHFTDSTWQHDGNNHWQACTGIAAKSSTFGRAYQRRGQGDHRSHRNHRGRKDLCLHGMRQGAQDRGDPGIGQPANGANEAYEDRGSEPACAVDRAAGFRRAAGVGGTVLYRKKNHA